MSTTQTFNVGDIVQLKSGGPEMTVKSEHINTRTNQLTGYYCQWFAGKKLEQGQFPPDSLELVTKDDD